jgi:hypothetical protein
VYVDNDPIVLAHGQALLDSDATEQVVTALMDAVPPGSYLAVSTTTSDINTDRMTSVASQLNKQMGPTRLTPRTRDQIARFFDGTDLGQPGLVHLPQWRATPDPGLVVALLAGVGRKR